MKTKKIVLAAGLILAFSVNASAALVEGQDYIVLPKPTPQINPNKIEVMEFFGYFCVHCYNLDPILLRHAKTWSNDTYLRTEHVVWQPEMLGMARIAAAVNQSGLKYQANPAVFKAIYEQKQDLSEPATFKKWASEQTSFDAKKLIAAYDSPASQAAAQRMAKLTQDLKIEGTPVIIVGGKYEMKLSGDWEASVKKVEEMVQKVRMERGMKAASKGGKLKSKGASFAKSANQ